MRQLVNPILKPASPDDTGKTTVTQLWQGDTQLINAVDRVNWDEPDGNLQVLLCHCGYVGCAPGGWVALRRAGKMALILPAFQKIDQASRHLENEYLPPDYLSQQGALWLDRLFYQERFCGLVPSPNFDQLPQLTAWEASKLFQWEAPHQVLGNSHSAPKLLPDIVIASSEGSFLEQVPILTRLMRMLGEGCDRITLRPIAPYETMISFYLDLAGIPQWHALAYDGSDYRLYLDPGYVIERVRSLQ